MTRLEKCKYALKLGFTYDEVTGNVTTPTGKIVQKLTKNGYLMLCFRNDKRKMFYLLAHQFGWYFKYKKVIVLIDHKNRIKTDNSINNLRELTKNQNAMNMDTKNIKGYYYSNKQKKYIAYIMVNYKRTQLGSFNTPDEARSCYLDNKKIYHLIPN